MLKGALGKVGFGCDRYSGIKIVIFVLAFLVLYIGYADLHVIIISIRSNRTLGS